MGPPHRPSERHKRAWTFGGLLTAGGVIAIVLLVLLLGHPFRAPTDTATEPEPVVPDSATPTELEPAGWIVMSWTLPGTGKPNLWLFAPNGDRRMPLTDDPEAFDGHPCFSPDGRRVAFIRGVRFDEPTSLWICRADGTAQRAVVTPDSQAERLLSPAWLSDSELCYTRDPFLDRRPDMELWSVDVDQGRPRLMFRYGDILQGGNGVVTDVSPDAEELAVVAQSNWPWPTANVYLTDRQGRLLATVWQDDPDDRKDARALWSPDGSQLAWHHNFTRGALADRFYYGIGWAQRSSDGAWRPRLQPNPELTMTPLAWAPGDALLLCARISSNGSRATLVLMDDELQITRELFELETPGWQFGQRDFGRLADWAIIPDDVELPDGQ